MLPVNSDFLFVYFESGAFKINGFKIFIVAQDLYKFSFILIYISCLKHLSDRKTIIKSWIFRFFFIKSNHLFFISLFQTHSFKYKFNTHLILSHLCYIFIIIFFQIKIKSIFWRRIKNLMILCDILNKKDWKNIKKRTSRNES